MKVLAISATFPSVADPTRGVFVKERLKALSEIDGISVRVVSPTPWFPPLKRFPKWYRWSQYPAYEVFDGLPTANPRYALPPKVGGYFHPQLMAASVTKSIDKLRQEYAFDVLDAHYVYPAGAFAAKLGKRYGVPVVMTGRGEDMERFPNLPLVGNRIRWALRQANSCIGVSRQISQAMIDNGGDPDHTHVIPNGVDIDKFHRKPMDDCRRRLELPADRKIILSVGDRLELKGYHLLVDAMPEVLKKHADAMYVIVGGPGRFGRDHTSEIESRIAEHGIEERVRLVGPRPHTELVDWYNAADLYALMSSREGSPNVLLEALACGTPAVGTGVGGIGDELEDPTRGLIIPQRTAAAAADTLSQALGHSFDRDAIRQQMTRRTWAATADRVQEVLASAIRDYRR